MNDRKLNRQVKTKKKVLTILQEMLESAATNSGTRFTATVHGSELERTSGMLITYPAGKRLTSQHTHSTTEYKRGGNSSYPERGKQENQ